MMERALQQCFVYTCNGGRGLVIVLCLLCNDARGLAAVKQKHKSRQGFPTFFLDAEVAKGMLSLRPKGEG